MILSIRNKLEVVMNQKLKRHRYPVTIISFAVWSYHGFNDRYCCPIPPKKIRQASLPLDWNYL